MPAEQGSSSSLMVLSSGESHVLSARLNMRRQGCERLPFLAPPILNCGTAVAAPVVRSPYHNARSAALSGPASIAPRVCRIMPASPLCARTAAARREAECAWRSMYSVPPPEVG